MAKGKKMKGQGEFDDLRLLIIPLVSSNSPCPFIFFYLAIVFFLQIYSC
jgi:hypothetical protein